MVASPYSSVVNTPGPSPEMPKHIHADVMATLPAHTRQLNPPRTPMYVPAVLRPTERPVRQFPPTPPQSNNASVDSLDALDARQLSRVSTDTSMKKKFSLGRVAEDEWVGEEGVGRVTGPPGKDHWKVSTISSVPFCSLRLHGNNPCTCRGSIFF